MPNGAQVHFTAESWANNDARFLPGLIKDRHGNQINIYHRTLSNGVVVMDYVIDTAGRRIDFNYENNRLVSVSQNRGGEVFYYVWLDYQPVTIQTRFGPFALTYGTDPSNINDTQVYFPVRLSYPSGVQYRLSYTSYGQIRAIEKWVPTIAGQGNERKVASTSFYLPHQPGGMWQLDCPIIGDRTEWAENWQGGANVVYGYLTGAYGGNYNGDVTDPTQQRRFRLEINGMVQSFSIQPLVEGEWGDWIKKDETTWTSDSGLSYISNPRPQETKSQARNSDGSITTKRSTFGYIQRDGMWLPNVRDDYNQSSVYRRATTEYTSYPAQYLLGLPQTVSVYAGPGTTLLSSVTNNYDETGVFTDSDNQSAPYFIDASGEGVIQHDDANYGFGFTARGNVTSVTQHKVEGGVVTGSRVIKRTSYDTNGNVRAVTDGAGNRQQIVYSDYYTNKPGGMGQTHVPPYTSADPTGFRAGSQWDYFTGLPVKTFNLLPGGTTELQVVTTSYDFADRPLQTTRPDGGWVKTAYWDNWLATVASQLVDTGKTRYKFEQYDGAGRAYRKASDHPDGVAGKYAGQIVVFNKLGQVEDTSNVAAINGSWTPSYEDAGTGFVFTHLTRDELDRLKIVTFADNNTRQYAYDGCGCAGGSETRATDELGRETITKTDFLGRLIEAIEPKPYGVYSKAVYIYDELDRLREIRHSDGGGVKTQYRYFNYDGYGRLQSENTPEGGVVTYTYKPNDLVETVANQRNITVTYGYNTRNLVNNISYSDGTPTATYGYDQYGARESMTDGEGATSYGYNNFRQLETETRTFTGLTNRSYKLSYTYDLADGVKQANYRIEQVTPFSTLYDKNVNYASNTVGALGGVGTNLIGSDPNATTNVLNSVTYRGSGALRSVIYGNNRQMAMGYDPNRQQPTSMKVDRVGNPSDKIIDFVYNYYDSNGNNNGRIRKVFDNTDSAYTTTYVYDDYHRLQSATASAYSRSYQYDAWGNITNFAGVTLSYQLNGSGAPATNRLSSDSQGVNYSYDQAGNMTQAGSAAYSYDGANRLKTAGGGTSTYGYDGDGKRVRVTDGGAAVFYVYSSKLGQVAMEVNSSGVWRAYVYVGGKQVAQQSVDGQFYWLHTNHLGSSRAMTDVNGNLVYKGQFDPYGQALLEWGSASLNTKKFTGYERDGATGLDYANARMYNSGRGRFLQADPARLSAANLRKPQSLNLYSYVENDPVNRYDPTGRNGILLNPCAFTICVRIETWESGGSDGRTGVFGNGSDNTSMGIELDPVPGPGDGGVDQQTEIQRRLKIFRDTIARVKHRLASSEFCSSLFDKMSDPSSHLDEMTLSTSSDFASEFVLANFMPKVVDGKREVGGSVDWNLNSWFFTGKIGGVPVENYFTAEFREANGFGELTEACAN